MTYQEAKSFLFTELANFQQKGKIAYKGTLDNAYALARITGNPQHKFKSIHVAGTNGKGSVSHIIAAGLQANGYKVGLFTSPHYKSYRERIKINGVFISEKKVAQFIETFQQDIIEIGPSFFEITSAMAFQHFAENQVDVAVIEVGLGGRLDSTNIINPMISVITNISLDHQKILGDTLTEIAGEKAGIIKQNVPVIIGESQPEIKEIFVKKAREMNATISFAEELSVLEKNHEFKNEAYIFNPHNASWPIHFENQMSSPFHIKNCRTALFALFHLKGLFNLKPELVEEGIKEINTLTYYIGRWNIVKNNPLVIFDSAHNEAGVLNLTSQLKKLKYKKLRIIWGSTEEKDIDKILNLLPKNAIYYFCSAQNARAIDAETLRNIAIEKGLFGYAYNSVKVAYRIAVVESNPDDAIIVAGSTFVTAELL
ncbi:MAG: Mur ligase family protein [Saprospiraceae bacterium]|nr:Mur ligase family protein [Saprospiraceae bacterium]